MRWFIGKSPDFEDQSWKTTVESRSDASNGCCCYGGGDAGWDNDREEFSDDGIEGERARCFEMGDEANAKGLWRNTAVETRLSSRRGIRCGRS